jgi:hypothetical protein
MQKIYTQGTLVYGILAILLLYGSGSHVAATLSAGLAYVSMLILVFDSDEDGVVSKAGALLNLLFLAASVASWCVGLVVNIWSF